MSGNILIPGYLRWDGTKYVLDPNVVGEQGPSGSPGAAGSTGPAGSVGPPGPSNLFIFRPGSTATANIYSSWTALWAARQAISGPATIIIDDSLTSGAGATIDVATYDFTRNTSLRGYKGTSTLSTATLPIFNIPDGAIINNPTDFENIKVVGFASTLTTYSIGFAAPYTTVSFSARDCWFQPGGTHQVVLMPGGTINLYGYTFFDGASNAGKFIMANTRANVTSSWNINLYDTANINSSSLSISGGGGAPTVNINIASGGAKYSGQSFGGALVTVTGGNFNSTWSTATGGSVLTKLNGTPATTSSAAWIQTTTEPNSQATNFTTNTGSLVLSDNNRGKRRSTTPGMLSGPLTTSATFSYVGGSVHLNDMCMIKIRTAGVIAAGNYLAIVDGNPAAAKPVIVLNRNNTSGAVSGSPLPTAGGLSDGVHIWNLIEFASGATISTNTIAAGVPQDVVYIAQSATGVVKAIDLVAGTVIAAASATLTPPLSRLFFDGINMNVVDGNGALQQWVNAWNPTAGPTAATFSGLSHMDSNCLGMCTDGQSLFIPQPTSGTLVKLAYGNLGNYTATVINSFIASPNNTIAYDGRYLWMTTTNGIVWQIDPATGQIYQTPTFSLAVLNDCVWTGTNIVVVDKSASISQISLYFIDPDQNQNAYNTFLSNASIAQGVAANINQAYRILARPVPDGVWIYALSPYGFDNSIALVQHTPFSST